MAFKRLITLFFLVGSAMAQETCRHCPVNLDEQFPEAPQSEQGQRLFTKAFWAPIVFSGAMNAWDKYDTISLEGKRCAEGMNGFPEIVERKEMVLEGIAEFGAVFGGTVLLRYAPHPKWMNWVQDVPGAISGGRHLQGAIQWETQCR